MQETNSYCTNIYIYVKTKSYSPNKDFSQGRGSYFSCTVIPLESRFAGRRPWYLSLGTQVQLLIAWIPGLLVAALGTFG